MSGAGEAWPGCRMVRAKYENCSTKYKTWNCAERLEESPGAIKAYTYANATWQDRLTLVR